MAHSDSSTRFLSFEEYEQTALRIGGGHWANYKNRWNYHRAAIDIIRMTVGSSSFSSLEMGTMGMSLVKGSDTIDWPEKWSDFEPTFRHDARVIPWPIEDRKYDFFIALRVFHHLFPKQRECFQEAKRIARNIIIVAPEHYDVPGYEDSRGISEQDFIGWNGGVPPTFLVKLAKGMGNLAFWKSEIESDVDQKVEPDNRKPATVISEPFPANESARGRIEGLPSFGHGKIDQFLKEATQRSGIALSSSEVQVKEITGGKSGAKISRISTEDGASFVLKRLRESEWWNKWVGSSCQEVELWASGVLTDLPAPLSAPILDVAYYSEAQEWWILMEDLTGRFLDHANFDPATFATFATGLAQLHAKLSDAAPGIDLCPARRHFEIFTQPILTVAGRMEPKGWLSSELRRDDLRLALPQLHDAFGESGFEFYLDLCEDKGQWFSEYLQFSQTFLHGDLQFQHIAPVSTHQIRVIDWNFPYRGAAAADLTWCLFLNFWCFSPGSRSDFPTVDAIKNTYLAELARAMGGEMDSEALDRSWQLSWLKAFAQLGWCLVHPSRPQAQNFDRAQAALKRAMLIAEKYA